MRRGREGPSSLKVRLAFGNVVGAVFDIPNRKVTSEIWLKSRGMRCSPISARFLSTSWWHC